MRTEQVKLAYGNPFTNDYLYDFAKVAGFFQYNPYSGESFAQRYAYLQRQQPADRCVAADVLREYNLRLGNGAESMQNIELLRNPETVAVITGQQSGLLGGPLYTVYKALTAIQLAERLSRELAKPVVPMFWIAAEDHDFSEINEVQVLDQAGLPTRCRLEFEPAGKCSVGEIGLPHEVSALLDELGRLTPETEFKPELLHTLSVSAAASDNFADWFGRIMVHWVGSLGLVFVNPLDRRLRDLEKNLFRTALERYAEVNAALSESAGALSQLGYPVAIAKDPGNLNLFLYQSGERLALQEQSDQFALRGSGELFSKDELARLIEDTPERFSPNVVLRPLTQDVLFPTLAYVGGPGEVNYFAQYQHVYPLFGLEMPIIYPRANISLVESSVEKCMAKYSLSLEDLLYRAEGIRSSYLDEQDTVGIDAVFSELQASVVAAYAKALETITPIDAGLEKLGADNQEKIIAQINWLKAKTLQAHRKANDVFLRQFGKACSGLVPKGQLQERYFSSVYYALKYGPDLWLKVAEVPLTEDTKHKLIFLK
ncbi:MAG: bacillithiol biosynthesis cysteine-adding enzyme BshC [Peptococcaceae bacterium]|nr:bacillithiol biosynthesis cysteine-adding enzyme BshC [Peptococcaceae bacterium]